jgi:ferredoxin-thioredoxin reductase catalytic subunit
MFVNNARTEFHKHVANGLVADTRSQPDGRDLCICRSSCLIRTERTQTGFCPSVPVTPSHN